MESSHLHAQHRILSGLYFSRRSCDSWQRRLVITETCRTTSAMRIDCHRGARRYCWTTHEAQSTDECGWLSVCKKSGEVERLLQIPIGFMPQPSNGFETDNALRTENIQAIETMDQSCAMSQAQLTRAFQCNKTLPYPVNDCMQVRKVQSLLRTAGSDMFLLERGFQPLRSSQPFQPKVNQPGKHFLIIHPPTYIVFWRRELLASVNDTPPHPLRNLQVASLH